MPLIDILSLCQLDDDNQQLLKKECSKFLLVFPMKDENITSDEDEPMIVDNTSQRLQASQRFFITFTQSLSLWKESCLK